MGYEGSGCCECASGYEKNAYGRCASINNVMEDPCSEGQVAINGKCQGKIYE